jgi:iron complex transport system substrate-binding protein
MRIASFLPGATEMAFLLGLGDQVVGVSHECDYPEAALSKPQLTRSILATDLTSAEIDRIVRARLRAQQSLYEIDENVLEQLAPDLVLTQDLCEVCAITKDDVQAAIGCLPHTPALLSIAPSSVEDVYHDLITLGAASGVEERATTVVGDLRRRVDQVVRRTTGARRPRVVCLEWLDPLMPGGHWVPEQVRLAGGDDRCGLPGHPSQRMAWEDVVAAQPEIIVLMPCGFPIERTLAELPLLSSKTGWADLPAVRNGRVFAVDGPAYFNRCGPRLVDGIELLAAIFHPDRCADLAPAAGSVRIAVEALTT